MKPEQKAATEKLKESDELFVLAEDIAPIFGANPQTIRTAAHSNPAGLGFKASAIGKIVRIPREPFLRWLEVE